MTKITHHFPMKKCPLHEDMLDPLERCGHCDGVGSHNRVPNPPFSRSPNVVKGNKYDAKATNPKDAIGSKKLGTTTVPDCVKFFCALGTIEGALKYGTANWSKAGVRCSIYLDALDRHISKFKAGEWRDPDTRVPHLSNALACIGIILDAHLRGKITDDRPPPNPDFIRWLDEAQDAVKHLQQMFAEHDPTHYTMATLGLAPSGKLYTGAS